MPVEMNDHTFAHMVRTTLGMASKLNDGSSNFEALGRVTKAVHEFAQVQKELETAQSIIRELRSEIDQSEEDRENHETV